MKFICNILFLCLFTQVYAQEQVVVLDTHLLNKLKKIEPSVGAKVFRFFYQEKLSAIYGVRASILLQHKYRPGIAFHESAYIRLPDFSAYGHTFLQKAKYKNVHFFAEYIFLNNYRWTADVGAGFGFSKGHYFYKRTDNLLDSTHKTSWMNTYTVSTSIEYKIWPFLGISGGVGYCHLNPSDDSEEQEQITNIFSRPFFKLNLALHFEELYKFFIHREIYDQERRAYLKMKNQR